MRRMFKRELGNGQTAFAALLAACALALGIAVFAAPDAAYALEGSGTEDDPFLITSASDYVDWRHEPSPGHASLQNDITLTDDDLDAAGHRTLEADENLNAQGHGQYGVEHTITLSLTRHRGLFDTVYGTVRNLRLQGNVSSSEGNVGAIAGTLGNGAWVVDCVNWANVTGSYNVGGFVGQLTVTDTKARQYLEKCANHGIVTATGAKSGDSNVGGIVGFVDCNGEDKDQRPEIDIVNCYNAGTVVGTKKNTGGIVGEAIAHKTKKGDYWGAYYPGGREEYVYGIPKKHSDIIIIRNCYSTGTVDGGTKDAAGIVAHIKGAVTVQGCYSAGSVTADDNKTAHGIVHWSESDYETTWFDKSMVYGEPISRCYSVDVDGHGWQDDMLTDERHNGSVAKPEWLSSADGYLENLQVCDFYQNAQDHQERSSLFKESPSADINGGFYILDGVGVGQEVSIGIYPLNGDEHSSIDGMYYGQSIGKEPKKPASREHYEFQYWTAQPPDTPLSDKKNENGMYTGGLYASAPERYDFSSRVFNNLHLYAYWTPELITVSFSENWPDDVDRTSVTVQPTTKTVTYGEKIGALASASMEPRSYEHVGWRTSKNSSKYDPVPVGPDFVVEEPYCSGDDLYLYALWTPNDFYLTKQPQDVTLDPKGGKHDRESMAVEISHPEYLDKIEYQWYQGDDPNDRSGFKPVPGTASHDKSHVVGPFDPSDANNHYYYYCEVTLTRSSDKTRSTIVSDIAHATVALSDPQDATVDRTRITYWADTVQEEPDGGRSYMYSVPVSFTVPRGDDNVNYYEIRLGDDVKQGNLSRSDQGRTIEREFDLRLTAQKDVAATVTLYHRMPDGRYSAASNTVSVPFKVPERSLLPVTSGNAVLTEAHIDPNDPDTIWAEPEPLPMPLDTGRPINAVADFTWNADPGEDVQTLWQYSTDGGGSWANVDLSDADHAGIVTRENAGGWQSRAYLALDAPRTYAPCVFRAVVSTVGASIDYGVSGPSPRLSILVPKPTNVEATVVHHADATIAWEWSTPSDPAKLFSVDYYPEGQESARRNISAKGVERSATLTSLSEKTTYVVSVTVWDEQDNAAVSDTFKFTTPQTPGGTPGVTPGVVSAKAYEPVELTALFTPLNSDSVIEGYQWQYSSSSEGGNWRDSSDGANEQTYRFEMARGETHYAAAVRCLITVSGEVFETPLVRVVEQVKDNIPPVISSYALTYSMDIRLARNLKDDSTSKYLVAYKQEDSEEWSYQMVEHSGDEDFDVRVAGLVPETKYQYKVCALTDDLIMRSPWSSIHSTTTLPEAAIGNVKIKNHHDKVIVGDEGSNLYLEASATQTPGPEHSDDWRVAFAYQWQYFDEAIGWVDEPNATGQSLYRTATAADYGRSWRCVVTETVYNRLIKGDPSDSQTTRASDPITVPITPPAVTSMTLEPDVRTIDVVWEPLEGVETYRITYTDQWGDKEYVVVPPDPHTSGVHYSFRDDGKACFVATGFAPETAYTISLSPIKFDEEGEVAQVTATTLKDVEYPVFIGQPQNAFVEAGASDAVSFSTVVAKPAMEGASLSATFDVRDADGEWRVFDKNVSQTTDAYGNTTFSYELSAPEGGWASDTTVRFSVSNRMNDRDGTSRRASEAAAVVVRPARPVPAVSDVATTSAKVAWENTAQSDRYAVFWTEDMTATLDALETGLAEADDARSLPSSFSSWNRVILNGLASTPQPEYVITGLTPGTRYKAAVVAAPSGGLWSKPSEEALFATLRDSSLEGVSVAPRRSMADAGQSVELAATPQFKDDASEAVSYEWQRLAEVSDGNGVWETIPDADQSVYRVDVTEATYGARFRCVASAGGGDTGVAPVSFASNNAVVWEDVRPDDPAGLSAQATSATQAELSWSGDTQRTTYTVEISVAGTDAWRSYEAGNATTLSVSELAAASAYEWRVTARGGNGLSSAAVDGPAFVTQPGSALARVAVVPSDTTLTDPGAAVELAAVTNAVGEGEELSYAWQKHVWSQREGEQEGVWFWENIPDATGSSYAASAPEGFTTDEYRCVVTSTCNGDERTVASEAAHVRLAPAVPAGLAATDVKKDSATLQWSAVPGEGAAYRVAYRPADGGDDAWVEQNVDAGSGDIVTFQVSGLQASTAYEWRVRTVVSLSGGELTSDWSDTQTFLTLSDSGLTKAVVAPALVRYDTTSGADVAFRVLTDASDATGLGYRWQRAAAGGDDWQDVTVGDHFAVDGDKLTVKAVFASTTEANGTKYRCVVSAGGNGAASVTKESTAGRLWHRVAAPTELAVGDTSLNGAELSWKGSPDYEGTFTLDYRAVGKEGGDGSWTTVEGIERDGEGNGSYALTGLDAATFYEWRVTFVTAAGGVSSETAVGSTFSTLEGSRLTSATVTPRAAVADEGDEVEFAVATNVDGDVAETMVRDWQTAPRGSDEWTSTGKSGSTLSLTVGADDLGTQVRCVVSSTKNGGTVEKASNAASLWKRLEVTPPASPAVDAGSLTVAKARLTWNCDAKIAGTFTVEYRAKDTAFGDDWTKVEGIEGNEANLKGLTSGTVYEWRVTHVLSSGLQSAAVAGPDFTTKAGSALSEATISPAVAVVDKGHEAVFAVTTNVDDDTAEGRSYTWQTAPRGSSAWTTVAGAAGSELTLKAEEDDLGTQVRCIVDSVKDGGTRRVVSNTAALWVRVDVVPPTNLAVDESRITSTSARLTWECDAQVKGTFTVEYRAAGGEWAAVEGIDHNEAVLRGLVPNTAYEWRVTHVLADKLQSVAVDGPGFATPDGSALYEATVAPPVAVVDKGQKAVFGVATNVDGDAAEKLTYTWQTAPRGTDAWTDVERVSSSQLSLTVGEDDLGTQVRCIVESDKNGTAGRAVSNVAKLWVRLDVAPPANPSIDETKLSASSARLTWECDAQVKGTFTVEYRAAGGEWVAIDDIEGNEAVLKDLAPATAYEWRVTHVLAPGLQSATVDGPGFTTKAGSALSEAKVTPEVVVADEGQKASFDVSTNVDGDASEKLSYVWQTAPRGSDAWADVPGANGSHLELTVGSDDLGTQVRCVVSSAKDGGEKSTVSNAAALWKRIQVAPPANLSVDANGLASTSARVIWECDAQIKGTFTVEYRSTGHAGWVAIEGVEGNEAVLEGLLPATAYEWRVTHVLAPGLQSATVDGPGFTTPDGPAPGPGPKPLPDPSGGGTVPTGDPLSVALGVLGTLAAACAVIAAFAAKRRRMH
ncbi:hypothetical protein GO727_09485 [Eggerthella lenta]|uniref:Fibronectin type-III domain-containing protein n=5 Tax=Eggerthella TaxID=84111 RepID=A0A844RQQ2_EGGLN|nr:fibronectin type III domain-containing protein [Eggerthella lenta]MVN33680.1 hypothetical protein [Eggerthella lenta]MVN46968.1 hypothetical protein [Eggerthella lenta]MVN53444.1 hypothetical protein [Eggerthella lenta]